MEDSKHSRYSEESNQEDDIETMEPTKKRGVKAGTIRKKYARRSSNERERVIAAARNFEDWRAVAIANGVPIPTAYGWIRNSDDDTPKKRGGARHCKVNPEIVEKIISYVEKDPLISLMEIHERLITDECLSLSVPTIHKYLDCQLYSVKKVFPQPVAMNSMENKAKRAAYVSAVLEKTGCGKTVVYIDETNCNLFLRRNFGRSRKGTRCSVKLPTSKGKNIHIIGGITQTGIQHWERRRGSYRKEDCCNFLRNLLRNMEEPMSEIVVVLDNAPVHVSLESVSQEEEFRGLELLRLAPYSAPLNPIEEVWSIFKSEAKKQHRHCLPGLLSNPTPDGMTQTEHRLQYLERIIDASMTKITNVICMKVCNHVQKHFNNCLALRDLNMGDQVNQH